jgi:T5orf172 domain
MSSIIYILINESMPNYIKIGKTSNLESRIKSLDNTSMALPFECYYACEVENMNFVERQLHEAFDDHRVRKNREFFSLAPERVVAVLKMVEIKNVTPKDLILNDKNNKEEDAKAIARAKNRSPVFNFSMVEIRPGSILTWFDDDRITCRVLDNRRVEYKNEIFYPTSAAKKVKNIDSAINGILYWVFEGETLSQRYSRYITGENN